MTGLVIGLIRFIWEFSYGPAPPCGEEDIRHALISKVHYLHFGILLFAIVCVVVIVISLLTKPIDEVHVSIKLISYQVVISCIYVFICTELICATVEETNLPVKV